MWVDVTVLFAKIMLYTEKTLTELVSSAQLILYISIVSYAAIRTTIKSPLTVLCVLEELFFTMYATKMAV